MCLLPAGSSLPEESHCCPCIVVCVLRSYVDTAAYCCPPAIAAAAAAATLLLLLLLLLLQAPAATISLQGQHTMGVYADSVHMCCAPESLTFVSTGRRLQSVTRSLQSC
jgi:hypothetical protein